MNSSVDPVSSSTASPTRVDVHAVLVREAGVPFQPPQAKDSGVDSFTEWLGLMEVVQMLCPEWPVRDKPLKGEQWKLGRHTDRLGDEAKREITLKKAAADFALLLHIPSGGAPAVADDQGALSRFTSSQTSGHRWSG